ncbi:MAG: class II aldolase/adducin family protein [Euzebyales bacterium]|nr:class II aldolase/adducin family protein [Euzebyales bacterium]
MGSDELTGRLATLGRRVVAGRLAIGSGGNLSARRPGADECVVTAAGAWLGELTATDFSVVALDGSHRGGHAAPSSEVALHVHAYRARPDANAVVHVHPQHAILLDALGHRIRLLTTDHVAYVRRIASVPFVTPGTAEAAVAVATALRDADVVMLRHHGCAVVGDSIEMAHRRAANLEEAATATFRALLLGDATSTCPPEYRLRLEAGESAGAREH